MPTKKARTNQVPKANQSAPQAPQPPDLEQRVNGLEQQFKALLTKLAHHGIR